MKKTILAASITALVGSVVFTSPSWSAERTGAAGPAGLHGAPLTKLPNPRQVLPLLTVKTPDRRTAEERRQPGKGVVSQHDKAAALRHKGRRNPGRPNIALLSTRTCASKNQVAAQQGMRPGKFASACDDETVKQKPVQIIVPR